jgi:dihydroorotate dehydrogenase
MIQFVYRALRPLLFRLDAERAHNLVFGGLVLAQRLVARHPPQPWSHPALAQRLWNTDFANPVGLAAGFDKDARAPHVWPLLGFGFAELGTITAHAQPGNPPPRLFRLPADRALINRLGFNNAGADAVARRLAHLHQATAPSIPIGINIGKSRVTPIEQAADDYAHSFRQLAAFATYVVINVSSPNTPGLRDLQAEDELSRLLATLVRENTTWAQQQHQSPRPLLIKVAPDLSEEALASIVNVARAGGADGLVATNTTVRRDGLTIATEEGGGLSGAPLRARATSVIRTLHRLAGGALPIIGVGGIFTADDAYEKIRAGASLVQLYTGMIYEGPRAAHRIAHGLVTLLARDGFPHIRDAVGTESRVTT